MHEGGGLSLQVSELNCPYDISSSSYPHLDLRFVFCFHRSLVLTRLLKSISGNPPNSTGMKVGSDKADFHHEGESNEVAAAN